MAFSGSTDFSFTRDQLIYSALRKCRAYDQDGADPAAYQVRAAAESLNLLLKQLSLRGSLLWANEEVTINLSKGQAMYTIGLDGAHVTGKRPLRIRNARWRDIATDVDIPLRIDSRDDYFDLPDKATTGTPAIVYYDRQISLGELYVWPVPENSKGQVIITAEVELDDFDAPNTTAYMPSYAYSYFVWALAAELGPEYGLDLNEIMTFEQKAAALKEELLDFEVANTGFRIMPGAY